MIHHDLCHITGAAVPDVLGRVRRVAKILRIILRDMTRYVYESSCNVPVILVRFYRNLKFIDKFINRFAKNTQISNFIQMRPVGADLFRADRRTDMTKLLFGFRIFANGPKNLTFCTHSVFVFCMDLRTNSDYFTVQHSLLVILNPDTACFLRRTS
jgi:hypothetical protein